MGASPLGGNVAGLGRRAKPSSPPNGVTIIGAQNLAASVPTAASNAYSRNISALLLHLVSASDRAPGARRSTPPTRSRRGSSSRTAARSSTPPSPSCSPGPAARRSEPREYADVGHAGHRPHHLRARAAGRHRGHRQGPGDPAHAADVGRQLDPRHRARGRAADRPHRAQRRRLRARVHRRLLRRRQRGRRLRGDRPDAEDVPPQGPAAPPPRPPRRAVGGETRRTGAAAANGHGPGSQAQHGRGRRRARSWTPSPPTSSLSTCSRPPASSSACT